MKKTLVSVDNLNDYVCQGCSMLSVNSSMILTPGAKDELKKRGVRVVYGEECCTSSGSQATSLEDLLLAIATILKTQYGIHDPEELKNISSQVVNVIRQNI